VLITRPIPPEKVLETLEKAAEQMRFNGRSSIMDPRFNNGTERFPLWVLSLWREMQRMIVNQKQWKSSVCWLELATHPEGVTEAKSLIERLPWNKPLHSGGVSTLQFAGFLGASWLSDIQLNTMVRVLQDRMKTEKYTKGSLVELLTLTWELMSIGDGRRELSTSVYLSRLADGIRAGTTTTWFPIHVNDCHWIAGRVDFKDHTFAFGGFDHVYRGPKNLLLLGDSMVASTLVTPPGKVLKGLQKWCNEWFGWKLTNMGNTLERPHQTDTHSCSICAMSTIAHGIFGDPLWQQRSASMHRVAWLLELNKHEELHISVGPVSVAD
jgi:hypothetical protein